MVTLARSERISQVVYVTMTLNQLQAGKQSRANTTRLLLIVIYSGFLHSVHFLCDLIFFV